MRLDFWLRTAQNVDLRRFKTVQCLYRLRDCCDCFVGLFRLGIHLRVGFVVFVEPYLERVVDANFTEIWVFLLDHDSHVIKELLRLGGKSQ